MDRFFYCCSSGRMRLFRIRMHIGFDRESQCSPRFVMLTDLNQYLNSDKNLNSKNERPIKIMQKSS